MKPQPVRTSILVLCLLVAGCGFKMQEIYRYTGGQRPIYEPAPSKQIEYIEAPERGPGAIEDGPIYPNGETSGGRTYDDGGRVGFADGTSKWLKPLSVQYKGGRLISVRQR